MSSACNICKAKIRLKDSAINCGGTCKRVFHVSCVSPNWDKLDKAVDELPGLSWRCDGCQRSCITVQVDEIDDFIKSKISSIEHSLLNCFETLRTDLVKMMESKLGGAPPDVGTSTKLFSSVAKSLPAVVVQPKKEQLCCATKSEILKTVNPIKANISVSRVINKTDGAVVIGCNDRNSSAKLKKMVEEKLSECYSVRELSGINPRVRIVGLTDHWEKVDLREYLIKMNPQIFNEDSTCTVLDISPTKNNSDIKQALLQIDKFTYTRATDAGHVIVGYDSCAVYDAINVLRCFRCNGFNHSSRNCKKEISCPKCAGKHAIKDCKSDTFGCVNCIKLNEGGDSKVTFNHAAWDVNCCTSFTRARERLKRDITGAN